MHEIARSILPGELVFDIGANAGDKTEWFLRRGARVVAVEPQPPSADVLRHRFAGNPNAVIVQKGLSEAKGTLTMYVNETSVLSTFTEKWKTGRFRDSDWGGEIRVEMTTLSQLVEEHGIPRYTKIDVEGYEKQVMLGLNHRIGAISLEFTVEFFDDLRDLIWYSCGIGYKLFNFSLGEDKKFALDAWTDASNLLVELHSACTSDPLAWGDVYLW